MVGAAGASLGALVDHPQAATLVQVSTVTVLAGALALCAYFGGLRPSGSWMAGLMETKAAELLKYWWWPGLAFASTYYLVLAGVVIFLLKQPGVPTPYAMCGGSLVAGLMALYGYYLGHRRQVEERQGVSLSPSLLRCPFVMGIMSKSSGPLLSVPQRDSTTMSASKSCSPFLSLQWPSASCPVSGFLLRMQRMRPICITKYRARPQGPAAPSPTDTVYSRIGSFDSRLVVWFVTQQHTYFGGFVLALPLFCALLEFLGLITKKPALSLRYDGLARDLAKVALLALSVTAVVGSLMLGMFLWLYPSFMKYMGGTFKAFMPAYAIVFVGESLLLILYYYSWNRMAEPGLKWIHAAIGILTNIFGTALLLLANSWAAFMMSPAGVDAQGRFLGNGWHLLLGALESAERPSLPGGYHVGWRCRAGLCLLPLFHEQDGW